MDPKNVKICQESWSRVLAAKEDTILIFYNRMFELSPDIKSLFKISDMKVQGKRLLAMLTMSVYMLSNAETLIPKLEDLGASHAKDHGVKKEHYLYAGQALIYLFEQVMGDEFTPDVKNAWLQVWGIIEACMTKCYDEKN